MNFASASTIMWPRACAFFPALMRSALSRFPRAFSCSLRLPEAEVHTEPHRFLERNTDNNSTLYYIPSIIVARMRPVSIFVNPALSFASLMSTLDSSRHVRIQTRRLLNWESLFRKNGKLICFLWNFILNFIGLRMEPISWNSITNKNFWFIILSCKIL